ncbi:hypothetical protein HK099_008712, partial [Clydaea vesicula]
FWKARHLAKHSDIVYATEQELASAGPGNERLLSLDVYSHEAYPQNCPVIIYVHGNQWVAGDKKNIPPFLQYLVLKKWVVVSINHRLAPQFHFPQHVIDVKRSIRWVRKHISKFGGDPSYICISGSNSGGHLAALTALTANDPYYQPGFTDVDTTVKACIAISSCLDLTNYKSVWSRGFETWFAQTVLGKHTIKGEEEFLSMTSPLSLLKQKLQIRRKSSFNPNLTLVANATNDTSKPHEVTGEDDLVPFLIAQ